MARNKTPLKRSPLTRFQKIGFVVAPLILIPVVVVGVVSEGGDEADTGSIPLATTATQPPQTSTASEPADPEPSPTVEQSSGHSDGEEATEYDERHLQFGSTARFTTRAGKTNTPLEFTVSEPKRFKLSKDATLYDAKSSVLSEGKRQPTNVYFMVTVKNASVDESWDGNFFFSDVTETGDDEAVSEVDDGKVETLLGFNDGQDLEPGKLATVKNGFSVKSADNIQYELSVEGLAGTSFYWTT